LAAKLGDFGVAKVLSSTADLAKTQIGTPFYMSPELINSHPYSYKSDVWGLGCVLYEIINGHRAFDAQSLNGLALKIIKGSYTPISAGCSNSTKQLIQQMLTKNPSHRPSLKEILHMPLIRSKILPAYRSSIAAGTPESRSAIESALNNQLASLGLGGLVNAPAAKRKNKQRLQARLERAKDLQQREEQVLQQTIALLQQCLRDPSVADLTLREGQPLPPPPPPPAVAAHHGSRQGQLSPREEKLSPRSMQRKERPHQPQPPWAPNGDALRFDEVSQPSKQTRHRREHRSTSTGSEAARSKRGRSRARTEEIAEGPKLPEADISAVSWMLEYEHVQPENLAHPFQQCRQSVVHSSNSRHRPQPPPLPYEPSPPNEGPGASARSWRTSDGPFRARTLQHSLKLEALPSPPRPDELDEDSLSGSSLSFVDELDNKEKVRESEGALARTSLLKEKIDDSKAALQKYRMTIDMLQYSFEQPEDLATQRSDHEGRGQSHPHFNDEVGWGARPPAPGVVQDCSARLFKRCVEGLGHDTLMAARRVVSESLDAEELPSSLRQRMLQMLGSEKIGFLSLIDQLVHMERCWGLQDLG